MAEQRPSILIPIHLAQGILNYLQERPYREVSGLITDLVGFGAAPHECAPADAPLPPGVEQK